ncbi:hypothetical protein [Streptomyces sp. NPDC007088]|uniref:hypothetical protein n=1 Tax=Streptomyces sp. NPDC007088 TaxID=3364773 RepID=UPI0036A531E3
MTYTADFPMPHRWWIASPEGPPPRESSRYERAQVATLAVQNAIRDARIRTDTATEATTTSASAVSAPADHRDLEGETASAPHAVDHLGPDTALTPEQRAEMPEEYLEGHTTDPATWLSTPKNLDRLAAYTRAADTRRRVMGGRKAPAADPASPVDQHCQEHEQRRQQPGPGQGAGPPVVRRRAGRRRDGRRSHRARRAGAGVLRTALRSRLNTGVLRGNALQLYASIRCARETCASMRK